MTNEEAKTFLDNLKVCVEEHPIVADWLVEIENRKTENSSEKPNNCEGKNYCDDCLYTDTCDSKEFFYACTSKATISKMEQVDKDINVRSKDEPQTEEHCETCRHKDECEGATYEYKNTEWWCLAYAPIEDEPQPDCAWK